MKLSPHDFSSVSFAPEYSFVVSPACISLSSWTLMSTTWLRVVLVLVVNLLRDPKLLQLRILGVRLTRVVLAVVPIVFVAVSMYDLWDATKMTITTGYMPYDIW